jgi:hypothetical protein
MQLRQRFIIHNCWNEGWTQQSCYNELNGAASLRQIQFARWLAKPGDQQTGQTTLGKQPDIKPQEVEAVRNWDDSGLIQEKGVLGSQGASVSLVLAHPIHDFSRRTNSR